MFCIIYNPGEAPAYVNMSDLANMAASKRRELESDGTAKPGTSEVPLISMSCQHLQNFVVYVAYWKAIYFMEAMAINAEISGNWFNDSL